MGLKHVHFLWLSLAGGTCVLAGAGEDRPATAAPVLSAEGVNDYLVRGLRELFVLNKADNYWTQPQQKALAACVDWDGIRFRDDKLGYALRFLDVDSPVRKYQYSYNGANLQEVRTRALANCRRAAVADNSCSCDVLFENDNVVYAIPEGLIARLEREAIEDRRPEPIRPPGQSWRND